MKYIRGSSVTQIEIADDFYHAYRVCFHTGTNRIYAIPGFVNGLFACELYLKILVGKKAEGLKGKEGHSLYALYRLLGAEEKEQLNSAYSDGVYALEDLLKKIGNGFLAWRYVYEDGNEDFGDGYPFLYTEVFLNRYLPILKSMAEKRESRSDNSFRE